MKISDEQINAAFKGLNFGPHVNDSLEGKKAFLAMSVLKAASGYSMGWTAHMVLFHLGLLPNEAKVTRPKMESIRWAYHEIYG